MTDPVMIDLRRGDCLDVLPEIPDASVDAVITDPPYGLTDIRTADVVEALTAWIGGDREHVPTRLRAGFMRHEWDRFVPPPAVWDQCLRMLKPGGYLAAFSAPRTLDLMAMSIRLAGFEIRDDIMCWIGTQGMPKSKAQLKPAQEPITIARKPAPAPWLGIDDCRTPYTDAADLAAAQKRNPGRADVVTSGVYGADRPQQLVNVTGRHPANLVLCHAPDCCEHAGCVEGCPVAELDAATPGVTRFFPTFRFQPKAPASERPMIDGKGWSAVKPLGLMQWLVRLLSRPGALVLDPFGGTAATLAAAFAEDRRSLGIERDPFAYRLALQRLGELPESVEAVELDQLTAESAAALDDEFDQLDLFAPTPTARTDQ